MPDLDAALYKYIVCRDVNGVFINRIISVILKIPFLLFPVKGRKTYHYIFCQVFAVNIKKPGFFSAFESGRAV
jgi:hypothetical protein